MAPHTSCTPPEVRYLCIDTDSDGQRLDNFLLRELKGVPKTLVYRIIRSGEVRLNKARVQADSRVHAGDMLRIPPLRLPEPATTQAQTVPAREFPLLFEDDALLAVNKPAGVAVHGGSGVSFGMIEQLRRARPLVKGLELVHRLDRDTSGILLIAKKKSVLRELQNQFRERTTGKTYLALVLGQWPGQRKVIDLPLHKYLLPDGERRVKVTTEQDPQGLRSITLVRKLGPVHLPTAGSHFLPECTLLAVTIKTGRTHQIRVHLSHCGHPIVGDDKYGDFALNRELQRQGLERMFLHAWQLRFVHPGTRQEMQLQAQLPDELMGWADVARIFE